MEPFFGQELMVHLPHAAQRKHK